MLSCKKLHKKKCSKGLNLTFKHLSLSGTAAFYKIYNQRRICVTSLAYNYKYKKKNLKKIYYQSHHCVTLRFLQYLLHLAHYSITHQSLDFHYVLQLAQSRQFLLPTLAGASEP